MSIYEKESTINRFEVSINQLYEDLFFLPQAVSTFYQIGEFFPELKETVEYKKIENVLNSLQNPIKGRIARKIYVKELNKYAGILVAKAREKVEEVKKQKRKERVKIKREIIPIKIPRSPWYRIVEDVNKLSDSLWKDKTIIRNIIPIFEDLINDLQELGAPPKFHEDLGKYLELFYSVEDSELTIPQLKKISPSYVLKDKELGKLLTLVKHYAERRAKKEEEKLG
ncbi:MAG: hypothetical protein QXQ77_00735 [Candidatus Aenigmatarchaeota archaeon]